jgi:hypothetical protein
MKRRNLIAGVLAAIASIVPAKAQTLIAGDRACPLFGRHRWVFDRNEPRNEEPPGWWWEFSKCKCGAELRELVAGPRG